LDRHRRERRERATICDSLRREKYTEPLDAYLREQVHSQILVKPSAAR
jgi:hypothetical protein